MNSETHLAAVRDDALADRLHDARQAVGADVRMRVHEDVGGCAVARQNGQDPSDFAPFGRARVELAVGKRAGAAFTETVVAVGVDEAFAAQQRNVEAPRPHLLAALEQDGPEAAFDQPKRGEESGRARADYDDRRRSADVA